MADTERLRQAHEAAMQKSGATVGETKQDCPYQKCGDLWKGVHQETDKIGNLNDPFERNRKISAAYAKLYEDDTRLEWVGVAAIVSRQAGCAMNLAKEASGSVLPMKSGPASTALEALGKTNQAIFQDIYPVAVFYQKYGAKKLEQCAVDENGVHQASPKLVDAIKDIDSGTPEGLRTGSDKIANYEQRDIIQDHIYSKQEYKDAFEKNERWAKRPLGRWFGARPTQLPLSSECTDKDPVPFNGSITDPDARVAYYSKLMDTFQGQTPQWRTKTMESIGQLGR